MMRLLLLSLIISAGHCAPAQSSLEVQVELTRPDEGGSLSMAICPGPKAYDTVKGCIERTVRADGSVVRIQVADLPPGEYAIKALHDINSSGDMDYNMFGIPKEPYGFSNNVMGTLGPPDFEKAKFIVAPGRNITRFKMKG